MFKRQYVIKSVCLCMWVKMSVKRCCCCCRFFLTTIKSDLCAEISRCWSLFRFCFVHEHERTLHVCIVLDELLTPFTNFVAHSRLFSNGHFSSLIRVSQFWDYNKWLNEMKNIITSTVARSLRYTHQLSHWQQRTLYDDDGCDVVSLILWQCEIPTFGNHSAWLYMLT